MFKHAFAVFALASVVGCQGHAQSTSDDAAWQRYLHVLRASSLEWSTSQPFFIKAEYQLYDLDGNPSVKGTAEASWPATLLDPIRIHSSDLTVDEHSDYTRTYTREKYLVDQALESAMRPFRSATERKDFHLEPVGEEIGTVQIDCFSILPPGTQRTPSTTVYCTNSNNQIVDITGDQYVIAREDFRVFRNHEVPMDITVSYEEKRAISLHVTELDELQPNSTVKSGLSIEARTVRVPAAIVAGMALKQKQPKYPFEAKMKKLSGTVVLAGIIGTDGKIAALDVIASPNSLLSKSSLDAVRKWEYRPYLLNGKPVRMETTISVNYSMGAD